jgi:hypothetical protein
LHAGDADLIACSGPCLIVVAAKISLPGATAIGRGMARLKQRYWKMCCIAITERKSAPGMDPECRAALVELTRTYTNSISGSAVVCEGSGFRATAVRSIVTAIQMASLASHPAKVFASIEQALEWLASTQPEAAFDVFGMMESIDALRASLRERLDRGAAASPGV